MATIRLRNARLGSIEYGLEPWGEAYDLGPGTTLTLVSDSPNGEYLEIVLEDARITTWSDAGSTVTLFEGDHELGSSLAPRIPVPRYPPSIGHSWLPLHQSAAYRVELALLNCSSRSLALWTPSQSELYTLLPGTKCEMVAAGMNSGPIELELTEDAVMSHGWPASQIALLEETP